MKTSIATVSVSGNLLEKLEAIAAAGFDGIEIFEQDFIAHDGSPREVGQIVRDHGLEIMLFQPFRDFEGLPNRLRDRAFDRAERKFDVMQELGVDLLLLCSSVHPEALGGIDRAVADLQKLGERAAQRGLRLGYEALAWGRYVNDHRDAWEIVRRVDRPNVGLVLDSFHTLARGIDPDSIRRIPGDKVFFVQLADAPRIEMDLLYLSRHFRNMPGEGDLPVLDFMRSIAAIGYDGPVSLEIFNDQFRGGSPKGIAKDGRRSLAYLLDEVRRSEPDAPRTIDDLPARIRVDGVAFIEFATSDEEAARLAALLNVMGFRHEGDHISKQVALWRQGEIRLVINTDPDGYANSSYMAHGTGVCDIGLRVGNAADTVARAHAMRAETFTQPVGPGELDIPAIRGVGGSVVHFIDESSDLSRVWDLEFRAASPAAPANDVGLLRIDHIGETMSYDEMLSWSLFYRSIFEMENAPMVDVVDPDGLVRSQAVEALNRSVRVTLNGAETHRTLAGRFLADTLGSAVQHIALATSDIFATAERMVRNGFEPLPIPQNYYDDLATRFDLSADHLARMQAFHILYDEDALGAFHQMYSRPFGDGMFFEIVQRSAGYDGYGAANAPFRTAAQKRFSRAKGMPQIGGKATRGAGNHGL